MINWRSIEKDGYPTDQNVGYLVSDGKIIEYSDIEFNYNFSGKKISSKWIGGSVYAVYEEVSGTEFDFDVKFWCPTNELNLPK